MSLRHFFFFSLVMPAQRRELKLSAVDVCEWISSVSTPLAERSEIVQESLGECARLDSAVAFEGHVTDREKIEYAKSYLRRTKSVPELKQLADDVYKAATQTITLRSGAFEGGQSLGRYHV
jgi:hypothetical protein